jgi:hypothetical protein
MIGSEFPLLLVVAVSRFSYCLPISISARHQLRLKQPESDSVAITDFIFVSRGLPMMKKWRRGGGSNTQGKRRQRVPANLTKL